MPTPKKRSVTPKVSHEVMVIPPPKLTVSLESETMSEKIDPIITPTAEAFKANFEKFQASFGDVATHSKANLEALSTSAKIASEGLKKASELSMAYMQSSAALATQTAKSLSGVKSLQEAVEIQADYAKTAMGNYFAEFTKVSDVMLGAVKESVKPISERTSALMSSIQSAH
jgi:hypothetical protein